MSMGQIQEDVSESPTPHSQMKLKQTKDITKIPKYCFPGWGVGKIMPFFPF